MMRRVFRGIADGLVVLLIAGNGWAWGPKTQVAVVTNAMYLLSKNANIPLERLDKDVRAGAMVSLEMLEQARPEFKTNPAVAIEMEMQLLRRVKSDKLDPFFAYRLGILGKMVAEAVSPMRTATASFRNLYYVDADKRIEGVSLTTPPVQKIDPSIYFPAIIQEANSHNDAVIKDYQTGTGFDGIGAMALPADAGRAVNAVVNTWNTLLTEGEQTSNISEAQLQKLVSDAIAYYVDRGNAREIDNALGRYTKLTPITPELRVRLGDSFYNAKLYDRAMEAYRAVHVAQPERKDVVDKIAEYNMKVGSEALEEKRLEAARDAFQAALDVNPLFTEAERERLKAETLITERDARQAADQAALHEGLDLIAQAEQAAQARKFADAIGMLHQAQEQLDKVSDEFSGEKQQRTRALEQLRARNEEYKQEIVANAQTLAGIGFAADIPFMVQPKSAEPDKQILHKVLQSELEAGFAALEAKTKDAAAIR
jgi:tetratricopeptide (TPR) repeat protein